MADIPEEPFRLLATFVHENSTMRMCAPTPKQTTTIKKANHRKYGIGKWIRELPYR